DVLQLEDSISEQIAGALIPRLTGEEQEQLAKRGTDNAQAYEAYLRGRYHWHGLTERGFARAIEEYNRAVELDPSYALAHAAIAVYHIFLGIFGVVPFADSSAAAAEAALTAVKLDPDLSEAHAALGFAVHCRDFNWEGAEEHHRRAIELNPHNSAAHNWYSFLLLAQGRFEEAVAETHRAIELDPMTPLVTLSLAWCYYHSGRFEDALPVHRRVLEIEPRFPYGRLVYSWALMSAGAREDAVDEAERALELAGDRGQLYVNGLAAAYAAAGRRADAQRVLERLREMAAGEYVSPYFLALVHVHLGDKEKALLLLEEAVRVRDAWVVWLGVDPRFEPLRSEPRFQALVERTGNPLVTGGRAQPQERTQPTVAVLPFKLLDARRGGETGEDYLGLGLADAVITRLSNVRRFVMRPTSSVMRFLTGDADPLRAGGELGVEYVVDGHIRRAGDTLRVTVQLLNVREGATRWAARFDEKSADVLQLEDSISAQVAEALLPHLSGDERERLAKRGTDNPEAYDAYMRGRYHWNTFSEDGLAKALVSYSRAVALDPDYALAHAGIADYYNLLGVYTVLPTAETSAAAKEAALRAVALDPSLAEGYAALGFATLMREFDWETAAAHLRRSIELNPNYVTGRLWYSYFLGMTGQFDGAITEARRALELAPLTAFVRHTVSWAFYHARRYSEAEVAARKLSVDEPRYGLAQLFLCSVLRHTGAFDEAVEAGRRAVKLIGRSPYTLCWLASAYASAGGREQAYALLAEVGEMAASRYVSPYLLAAVHANLGERALTLAELNNALQIGDGRLAWLGVDPQFDPLRGDADFEEVLRRTNNPIVHTRTTASPVLPPAPAAERRARVAEMPPPGHSSDLPHRSADPSSRGDERMTEDEEAHKLYVAGRYFATRRTADGLRQAVTRFERAVERDPTFALAYAEMADCYALLNWYVEPPPAGAWARAREAALKAVEADDTLAEAHASLGFVLCHYDRDWPRAEAEFRRAIELKPDNPVARRWHALNLSAMGRHGEAVAEIRRAQVVSPRSPVIATAVAIVLFYAQRYDEAVEQCLRALEIDPGSLATHIVLRWSYEAQGMCEEALAIFEQEAAYAGDTPTTRTKHAHVLAACGRADEARAILRGIIERREEQWVTAYEIAVVYSLLGERDEAFAWLARAEEEHAVGLTYIRVDPRINELRSDPRFVELLRRANDPRARLGDDATGEPHSGDRT
ncbi:MAG TPA: tetratricopeptide repeat protein, partial [Pyrinomonadaceae bacterium]